MKYHLCLGLILILSFLKAPATLAANFAAPLLCPVQESYLQVENSSASSQSLWFQALGTSPFAEKHHSLPPHTTSVLALADDYSEDSTAIALKALNRGLKITSHCKNSPLRGAVDSQHSPWKSLKIPQGVQKLQLHLVNLAQTRNTLQIQFQLQASAPAAPALSTIDLPEEFVNTSLEIPVPPGARSVTLRGSGRWNGMVFNGTRKWPLVDEVPQLASAPTARYFLFRSPGSDESFVVPLQSPELIQQSLEQIADPNKARLLVARIGKSLQGTNRDLASATKSPWSWTVIEAQNYADFAHISCDGSPSVVEERLNDWIRNTGGTICFWNYRVQREVSVAEITQSFASEPLALEFPLRTHGQN